MLNPEVPEFVPGRLAMNLPSVESPKVSSAEVIAPLLLDIPAVVTRMEVSTSSRNDKVKLTDDLMDQYVPRPVSFSIVHRKFFLKLQRGSMVMFYGTDIKTD